METMLEYLIYLKQLEEYAIKVLQPISGTIDSYGLATVHRLGKVTPQKSRNVIVGFVIAKVHIFL